MTHRHEIGLLGEIREISFDRRLEVVDIFLTGEKDEDIAWRLGGVYLEDRLESSVAIVCLSFFGVESRNCELSTFDVEDWRTARGVRNTQTHAKGSELTR